MNPIIANSITNSFTYEAYRHLVATYAQEGKTSGHTQTEAYINYTKLNESRMHRLDKTIEVLEDVKSKLAQIPKRYIWLVLAETWCGDAAQVLPVIHKMAEVNTNIDLKIVLRDEHEELMQLFLTNGTQSIPKLIIIDTEKEDVIADFGPRPQGAKQLILDYKKAHGVVDEAAKIELQKWYLANKGVEIQQEIMALLN
ncbi:thioredoxin family protein [Flavobacterium aciduliphilum]|uniref:Thioredoxin-like protein n=1 Tax=Flavobacterium aciduliphilum TaxID=1101402 RepID=A0A328YDS3_9FLAO|nr:thioredoxin family protein [Flavobacterium aciduliphilum]RAR71680.1 thioredoxin-like protein [Flavobacterium aciduliphilum]